jgi:FkbM family methyltransferase
VREDAGRRERLSQLWQTMRAMEDSRSRARLVGMKLRTRLESGGEQTVGLRIRELGGAEFHVRPGTTDVGTIYHDFVEGEHLPPPPIRDQELKQLCELGSNVGAGAAGLAARYPSAEVVAVEPDPANAAICRRNLAPFGPRCRVVQTAIWDRAAALVVEGDEPSGYTVREAAATDPADRRVPATTIDTLLADEMPSGDVDYLILNLEGTEPRVLKAGGGWASRVRSIRCELHPHYGFGAEACTHLLEQLGFTAWTEPEPWGGWGFGVRQ